VLHCSQFCVSRCFICGLCDHLRLLRRPQVPFPPLPPPPPPIAVACRGLHFHPLLLPRRRNRYRCAVDASSAAFGGAGCGAAKEPPRRPGRCSPAGSSGRRSRSLRLSSALASDVTQASSADLSH
jgi:hypothetical protein